MSQRNAQASVWLNAPAQQVWDYIQEHALELDPAILRFDVEPAPGQGALNRITFRGPLGLRLKAESRIETWEPPHRYVVRSVKPAWPVRSRVEDTLEEIDGGTRYTVSVAIEPRFLASPLARLFLRFMMTTREQMMSALKTALEGRTGAP